MKSAKEGYSSSLEGEVLRSRFRIDKRIARGGMAWLFKGRDLQQDQDIAVKVLFPHHAEDPVLRARFIKEFKLQSSLTHPNIVRVIELLEEGELLGTVMEWVEGEDLKQALQRHEGPFPLEDLKRLSVPLLKALGYAHASGLVHRDIKPANVLLSWEGGTPTPKLTDFGIAKMLEETEGGAMTSTGSAIGTMRYMSPEQIRDSKHVDHKADIYSFGVVLYQLAAGRPPFKGSTENLMFQQLYEEPSLPTEYCATIPPPLEDVIMRCLQKQPEERFESCPVLLEALQKAIPLEPPPEEDPTEASPKVPKDLDLTISRPLISPYAAGLPPVYERAESPSGPLPTGRKSPETGEELSDPSHPSASAQPIIPQGSTQLPSVPGATPLPPTKHITKPVSQGPLDPLQPFPILGPSISPRPEPGQPPSLRPNKDLQQAMMTVEQAAPFLPEDTKQTPLGTEPPPQVADILTPIKEPQTHPKPKSKAPEKTLDLYEPALPPRVETGGMSWFRWGQVAGVLLLLLFALLWSFQDPTRPPTKKAPQDPTQPPQLSNQPQTMTGTCQGDISRSCYDGPSQARGKGICKLGRQLCIKGVWGPCLGAVAPRRKELCNGKDDDCDGKVDETFPLVGRICQRRIRGCRYRGRYQCNRRGRVYCRIRRRLRIPGVRRVQFNLSPSSTRFRIRYGRRTRYARRHTCIELRRSLQRVSISAKRHALCVFPLPYKQKTWYIRMQKQSDIEPPANYCIR